MAVTREEALSLAKRYRFAIWLSVVGAVFFFAGVIIGFCFNGVKLPHFGPEAAKAVVTLGTGLILGGALKALLDSHQNALKEREEDHELRERLLTDLRDVHDRAENARLMILADKSTVAYAEQMRELIGCQVTLLNIKRTQNLPPDETQGVNRNAERLANVIGYLRALQLEYVHNYSGLVDRQHYDEATTRHRLSEVAATGARFQPGDSAASDQAWHFLNDRSEFPVFDDMISGGDRYMTQFRHPLHKLIGYLRDKTEDPKMDTEFDRRVDGIAGAITKGLQSLQPESD